jgi:hypothetical protein
LVIGFRVQDIRFRAKNLGFGVLVQGLGFSMDRFKVYDLGRRV